MTEKKFVVGMQHFSNAEIKAERYFTDSEGYLYFMNDKNGEIARFKDWVFVIREDAATTV
jgi:hypothetical protein